MPFVLALAFAASLGLHGLLLVVPDLDLSMAADPPPLIVEVKPSVAVPLATPPQTEVPSPAARPRPPVRRARPAPRLLPKVNVATAQANETLPPAANGTLAEPLAADPAVITGDAEGNEAAAESATRAPAVSLPSRGRIEYRVERGDQGFQVGRAVHQWEVVEGAYRIVATTETSGLVGLFRPLQVELESRGRLTATGLRPEQFRSRQTQRETEEGADFDWDAMRLQLRTRPPQPLSPGTQDLLSLYYQLGLMDKLTTGTSLPIVTGKKLTTYPLEVVGDETIETPAGTFRCLHLRVQGSTTTDLWLAYDRALLPVRVQHADRRGDLYVQVVTAIDLGGDL